jgi:hypothetical protein
VIKAALRNVMAAKLNGKEAKFDRPVSIWQALDELQKQKRDDR